MGVATGKIHTSLAPPTVGPPGPWASLPQPRAFLPLATRAPLAHAYEREASGACNPRLAGRFQDIQAAPFSFQAALPVATKAPALNLGTATKGNKRRREAVAVAMVASAYAFAGDDWIPHAAEGRDVRPKVPGGGLLGAISRFNV